MNDVTFLYLGDSPPDIPGVKVYPRAQPRADILYATRVKATREVTTEFFCWVDGGEDALPEDFAQRIESSKHILRRTGAGLVYGDEIERGVLVKRGPWHADYIKTRPFEIHHAPLVSTTAAHSITYPTGCYWYEGICYWQIALQNGARYLPGVHYVWEPSAGGARRWPSTGRGINNAISHVHGRPGVHLEHEKPGHTSRAEIVNVTAGDKIVTGHGALL